MLELGPLERPYGLTRQQISFQQQPKYRIWKFSRNRHGIKGFGYAWQPVGLDQNTRFQLVLHDDRRKHGKADIFARQKPHHCHILYLCHDLRTDAQTSYKRIKADLYAAIHRRQDDRM